MSSPKVSICIPTYKQIDYLRNTLKSILVQKYTDYEIIITDDSPDDSVGNLIKEFNFKNKLKYFKNENQLGSPKNWNEAVRKSTGEYIKILHHDDWFKDSSSLGAFVALLDENPENDFAFCASEAMNNKEELLYLHKPNANRLKKIFQTPDLLFFGNIIGAPSATIYRKKINIEYDKKLKWLVDIDFYIKALKKSNFSYSEKPLIRITTEGPHQVTKAVLENKKIEISENLYLYKIIKKNKNILQNFFFTLNFFRYKTFLDKISAKEILRNKAPFELVFIFFLLSFKRLHKKIIKIAILITSYMKIRKHLGKFIKKFRKKYTASFAQSGEDIIVDYIFTHELKIKKPSYLDIGSFNPVILSNTYLLYKKGSKGVCVEPDSDLCKQIKKNRKKDNCLNVGVGINDSPGIKDFYQMSKRTLNTFSKEEADRFVSEGYKIVSVLKIPTLPINRIISENFIDKPNFVSIDTEGLDFEILKTLDFKKFRPEIFCVETLTFSGKKESKLNEIIEFMKEKNYFVYADTYINTIFVDNEIWLKRHENN